MSQTSPGMDPMLHRFLREQDQVVADRLLSELICEYADPIIEQIIKNKLRVSLQQDLGSKENQDALELVSNLRARIISDLRDLQTNSSQRVIASFPDYTAIKTFSACADYFRQKNPLRSLLKSQLRRHLKQHSQFDLWKGVDNRWYAGRSEWKAPVDAIAAAESAMRELEDDNDSPVVREGESTSLDNILSELFTQAGRPILFDRVVTLVAER
ncbi:MAG TPA: hypothetical protein VJS64_14880, partial [Pyrinomonadaceae bacterium]|nr:hypothetical protein [Pyrinomonadaceae bacterium]